MIIKYLNENVLLIPDTIYRERNNYIFEWKIDKRIKLSGSTATYSFVKPGVHEIELKVTDKRCDSVSVYNNIISVKNKEQKYIPEFITPSILGFGVGEFGYEDFGG